jgi:hypothetical protein
MNTNTIQYLLTATVYCANIKGVVDAGLKRLYDTFLYLVSPRLYVFFEEYSMPFPAFSLSKEHKLMAKPVLVYNADEHVFFPYVPLKSYAEVLIYNKARPLPILSMEILDENKMPVNDLTDFVEKLRYVYMEDMETPSISNIISAWCLTHYLPLNRSRYTVRYIMSNGEEVNVSLIDTTPLDD